MQIWWDILLTQWMFSYAAHKAIVIFVKHLLCEFKQMLPFSSEIWGVQCSSPLSVVSILSTGSWRLCLWRPSWVLEVEDPVSALTIISISPINSEAWKKNLRVYVITWHPNLLVLVRVTVLSLTLPCFGIQLWFQ